MTAEPQEKAGPQGVENRTVSPDEGEVRLDRWFKRHYPGLTFGRLAKLARTGQIRVDGKRTKPQQRVEPGQTIRIPPLPADSAEDADESGAALSEADQQAAEALRERVLFRDDWVIALDKPAGLATQGGSRLTRHLDAMLDALRFDAAERPRLVHRLDKDTSGVLLLGRSARATDALGRAFRDKTADKVYWALTVGVPRPRAGRIDMPLGKQKRGGEEKMAHDPDGRTAITDYRTIASWKSRVAWLALSPLTGRTHQLRAHLAALGTPILGDGKYGGKEAFPPGVKVEQLCLHARELGLPHPQDQTTLRVTAPLPEHMRAIFETLGFDSRHGEGIHPTPN